MSVVPKLPASRALARLDAAIASATDPNDATCRRAERAALLARHGHLEQARAELDALPHDEPPRVAAWLALAEGLVRYFNDLDASARERVHAAFEGARPRGSPRCMRWPRHGSRTWTTCSTTRRT